MEILFISFGLFILYIFLFSRGLLINKTSSIIISVICIVLLIVSYFLQQRDIKGAEALKIPVLQYFLYRLFHFFFVKIYKREPKDTFWTMDKTLMKDGIFNALFWIIAFILPVILVFEKII